MSFFTENNEYVFIFIENFIHIISFNLLISQIVLLIKFWFMIKVTDILNFIYLI